jgi:hypothetical protein
MRYPVADGRIVPNSSRHGFARIGHKPEFTARSPFLAHAVILVAETIGAGVQRGRLTAELAASSIFHFLATAGLSLIKTLSWPTLSAASLGRIFKPSAFILSSMMTSASASQIV